MRVSYAYSWNEGKGPRIGSVWQESRCLSRPGWQEQVSEGTGKRKTPGKESEELDFKI